MVIWRPEFASVYTCFQFAYGPSAMAGAGATLPFISSRNYLYPLPP